MGRSPAVSNLFNNNCSSSFCFCALITTSLRILCSLRTRALSTQSSVCLSCSVVISSLCTCALSTLSASRCDLAAANFASCPVSSASYCTVCILLLLVVVVTFWCRVPQYPHNLQTQLYLHLGLENLIINIIIIIVTLFSM